MNLRAVEQIAKAVLYEGYMLYPYRPSAVKNQQRWNFGVLYPQSYSEAQQGADAWVSQTECLVRGSVFPSIEVRVRFLQLVERTIGRLAEPLAEWPANNQADFELVPSLEVGQRTFQPWQEAEEREISIRLLYGDSLAPVPSQARHDFLAARQFEPLRNESNRVVGVIVRDKASLSVVVETSAKRCESDVFKITVRICNRTPFEAPEQQTRDHALMHSLISAHSVLGANNCEFVSLLDPPDELREVASSCQNAGTWPVLVGAAGSHDTMLSSPIILYDYPQIAPESAGDLFDGLEIDEILSLRIMTMTDEEKREMRDSDDRARQILERTESLPPEQLMKLHGVLRSLRPLDKETS
jgi:hypothetical protein